MADQSQPPSPPIEKRGPPSPDRAELGKRIGVKELRKIRARQRHGSIWFGLGMFGVIGWSVAIPTLLGLMIGVWIDSTWPSRYSWTLMFLVLGLGLGCLNAWRWIERERRMIEKEEHRDKGSS